MTISPVVCQKFPKSLPLFTNYRDLDPEHITNLILQFSGLINKQKMDIKAVYLQEGLIIKHLSILNNKRFGTYNRRNSQIYCSYDI